MILRIVGNENLTLEMYIMQLVHLKNIDERKEDLKLKIIKYLNENLIGKKIEDKFRNNIPIKLKIS